MSGKANAVLFDRGTRDFSQLRCEVPTTCQPPSAYRKEAWPAIIRDVGPSQMSLSLQRRFEMGSGLAIALPCADGSTSTIFGRVVHVRTFESGFWLLGCQLISELSDEEVQFVLDRRPDDLATDDGPVDTEAKLETVSDVLFQVRLPGGEILRWVVRQLQLGKAWPVVRGDVVSLQVAGVPAGEVCLKVKACRQWGAYWIVDSTFRRVPCAGTLAVLTRSSSEAGI